MRRPPTRQLRRRAADCNHMKIAVFTFVCDSTSSADFADVAVDAVRGLILSLGGQHDLRFLFVDDASRNHVGDTLRHMCEDMGLDAHVIRLEEPLGYRDACVRTRVAIAYVADHWSDVDLVLKTDCDAIVVRRDLGTALGEWCRERVRPVCWGAVRPMRYRDRVLYIADILPAGFRRAMRHGQFRREWELRRWKPVWWSRWGWRAIRKGFRFRFPAGSFYILNAAAIRGLANAGRLAAVSPGRYGLMVSEEDVLVATLLLGIDGEVVDLSGVVPGWSQLSLGGAESLAIIRQQGAYVVHPIKRVCTFLQDIRSLHTTWFDRGGDVRSV